MSDPCKHTNAVQDEHPDSGAHIAFCPDCKRIIHACFKPLDDHIEKNLELVRAWGVAVSKADGRRPSDSAAIQREVEAVIRNLREAALMSRATKNSLLEDLSALFEARGERDLAMRMRDLKLEIAIKPPAADAAAAVQPH